MLGCIFALDGNGPADGEVLGRPLVIGDPVWELEAAMSGREGFRFAVLPSSLTMAAEQALRPTTPLTVMGVQNEHAQRVFDSWSQLRLGALGAIIPLPQTLRS